MTCDPHANLHLGLSAEAMVLIDPQLADRPASDGARQRVLIFSIPLLMLLSGVPIMQEAAFVNWQNPWNAPDAATSRP